MKQCSYCNQKISFFGTLFGGIDHSECNAEASKHRSFIRNYIKSEVMLGRFNKIAPNEFAEAQKFLSGTLEIEESTAAGFDDAVETAKITDANVTGAKLNLSTGPIKQPNFFVVGAGTDTTSSNDTDIHVSVTGMLGTDICLASLASTSTPDHNVDISFIKPHATDAGKLTYHLYSLGSGSATIQYVVYREVTT